MIGWIVVGAVVYAGLVVVMLALCKAGARADEVPE